MLSARKRSAALTRHKTNEVGDIRGEPRQQIVTLSVENSIAVVMKCCRHAIVDKTSMLNEGIPQRAYINPPLPGKR